MSVLLVLLFIIFSITHVLIISVYGTSYRGNQSLSQMGIYGYLHVLEWCFLLPNLILYCRLLLTKNLYISTRVFAAIYGTIILFTPVSVIHIAVGFLYVLTFIKPSLMIKKSTLVSYIIAFTFTVSLFLFGLVMLKGVALGSSSDFILKYFQYRISVWYVSWAVIFDQPYTQRLNLFMQALYGDNSINVGNAQNIYSSAAKFKENAGAGPGILGSSLYVLPFPVNLVLVFLYAFFVTYLMRAAGLYSKNANIFLVLLTIVILFPLIAGPIVYFGFEIVPILNLFLISGFCTLSIKQNNR